MQNARSCAKPFLMLGTLDEFIDSLNPVSSPVIDMDQDLSLELSLHGDKMIHLYDSSFFNDDSSIDMSSEEEILPFMQSNNQNNSNAPKSKRKMAIKSVIFHPFTSLQNTEVTVQHLKRFFNQTKKNSTKE